jgi:hypothetical protein
VLFQIIIVHCRFMLNGFRMISFLCTLIVAEAVRRNQLTARAAQAEVGREIKLWFRRAPTGTGAVVSVATKRTVAGLC